jgi:lysozyme family protein
MSQSNFETCLAKMLAHEGGYVNHPQDPGGMTNLGVTKRVWEEWVGHEVDEKQMRALTPQIVAPLYKRKYWDAIRGDELVSGVDYVVFDVAVNSGPGRAIKILQDCVGATVDGGFGPGTLAAVKVAESDPKKLINLYCDKRLEFLMSLKNFVTFSRGWINRVADVRESAIAMI